MAKIDRIKSLADCVKTLSDMGHDIVIVHGAGSFGHIRARQFRLNEGDVPGMEQESGVEQVRNDMDELHEHVIESLIPLTTNSHPPRDFVVNTGVDFVGNLDRFLEPGIHVTFGDVVQ